MRQTYFCLVPIIRGDAQAFTIGRSTVRYNEPKHYRAVCREVRQLVIRSFVKPFPSAYGKLEAEYIPGHGLSIDAVLYGLTLSPASKRRLNKEVARLSNIKINFTNPASSQPNELPRTKVIMIVG